MNLPTTAAWIKINSNRDICDAIPPFSTRKKSWITLISYWMQENWPEYLQQTHMWITFYKVCNETKICTTQGSVSYCQESQHTTYTYMHTSYNMLRGDMIERRNSQGRHEYFGHSLINHAITVIFAFWWWRNQRQQLAVKHYLSAMKISRILQVFVSLAMPRTTKANIY